MADDHSDLHVTQLAQALDRGDAPALAALYKNQYARFSRHARETKDELTKITNKVDETLMQFDSAPHLNAHTDLLVKKDKDGIVEPSLEMVDDISQLMMIVSDPLAKRKYQHNLTIFVVGYENACRNRLQLIAQINKFFVDHLVRADEFPDIHDLDFDVDAVGRSVSFALDRAQKTHEKLERVSHDVLKVLENVNPDSLKRRKRKLEKSLQQSKEHVTLLTQKLTDAQIELGASSDRVSQLSRNLEVKQIEIERLSEQLASRKDQERDTHDWKKQFQEQNLNYQEAKLEVERLSMKVEHLEEKLHQHSEREKLSKIALQKMEYDHERKIESLQKRLNETKTTLESQAVQQQTSLAEESKSKLDNEKQKQEKKLMEMQGDLDALRKAKEAIENSYLDLLDKYQCELKERKLNEKHVSFKVAAGQIKNVLGMMGPKTADESKNAVPVSNQTATPNASVISVSVQTDREDPVHTLSDAKREGPKEPTSVDLTGDYVNIMNKEFAELREKDSANVEAINALKKEKMSRDQELENMRQQLMHMKNVKEAAEKETEDLLIQLEALGVTKEGQWTSKPAYPEEDLKSVGEISSARPENPLGRDEMLYLSRSPELLTPLLANMSDGDSGLSLPAMQDLPAADWLDSGTGKRSGAQISSPAARGLGSRISSAMSDRAKNRLIRSVGRDSVREVYDLYRALVEFKEAFECEAEAPELTEITLENDSEMPLAEISKIVVNSKKIIASMTRVLSERGGGGEVSLEYLLEAQDVASKGDTLPGPSLSAGNKPNSSRARLLADYKELARRHDLLEQDYQTLKKQFEAISKNSDPEGSVKASKRSVKAFGMTGMPISETEGSLSIPCGQGEAFVQRPSSDLPVTLEDRNTERYMFTSVDMEFNSRMMSKGLDQHCLDADEFELVSQTMNEYVRIPQKQLAELAWRYAHFLKMRQADVTLMNPENQENGVAGFRERVDTFQRRRAINFKCKCKDLREQRQRLARVLIERLAEIQKRTGIFLIKPLRTQSLRSTLVLRKAPRVRESPNPRQFGKGHSYSKLMKDLQTATVPSIQPPRVLSNGLIFMDTSDVDCDKHFGLWEPPESRVISTSEHCREFERIPKLLELDVGRPMFSTNQVSVPLTASAMSGHMPDKQLNLISYITVSRHVQSCGEQTQNDAGGCRTLPIIGKEERFLVGASSSSVQA